MDFNLIYDNCGDKDADIVQKIRKAFELGFDTVAINTIVDSSQLEERNVKIPEPKVVDIEDRYPGGRKLKILNRLTAVLKDGIHGHHLMQCSTTKRYDMVAVQPIGEKMLQHVCGHMDVDIICLDLSEKLPFALKRTYMNQAKEKGACFEIQYSTCLRDQTSRRWCICNGQSLVRGLRGQNILLSSGALKVMELRGVHDVVNLGFLFGFKDNDAKAAVLSNGRTVLSHSGTRLKTGCGFVSVEEVFRLSKQNRWLVNACKVPRKEDETSAKNEGEDQPQKADQDSLNSPPSKKVKTDV